jgi:hypothetical protein
MFTTIPNWKRMSTSRCRATLSTRISRVFTSTGRKPYRRWSRVSSCPAYHIPNCCKPRTIPSCQKRYAPDGFTIKACRYSHTIIYKCGSDLSTPTYSDHLLTSDYRIRASHALYRTDYSLAYTPQLSLKQVFIAQIACEPSSGFRSITLFTVHNMSERFKKSHTHRTQAPTISIGSRTATHFLQPF